ncbi:amidohydrolase [Rhodobacteraceae bacterium CCMM004]|nr:amidohydrolase [Rhodobacteraceae bacterium CCMM004]
MPVIAGGHVSVDGARIASVGPGPGPEADEVIDADGDVVMPGMVNPHAHLPMTLFRGLGEDVDDRLFRYVLPLERRFVTPAMVRIGTTLAALEMIRGGVTCAADMYYFEAEVGRVLDAAGLRGVVGQTLADFDPPDHASMDEGFALTAALADEFAGHDRIVASIAPHAPYSTDIPVMARVADWAAARPEVRVQIHLAEMTSEMEWADRTHGCRPVAVVDRAGLLIPGLIAAHCLYLSEAEIARLAEADVRVAHNARSNAKAGRGIAPVAALRAAGVPVGIATDGPMSGNTLDLFAQFAPVSMFQKLLGRSRGPMPAVDVIAMATREGAEVLGLSDRIGTLEPDRSADLIRIGLGAPRLHPVYDIYATLVFAAMPDDVTDTMVAGRWLMRDRQVLSVEPKKALRDAGQIAASFRAEMARIDAG